MRLQSEGFDRGDIGVNAGHTGKGGVEKYYNGTAPYRRSIETKVIVDVNAVPELQNIATSGSLHTVWSGVTLNKLIAYFGSVDYAPFQAAQRHISVVANNQVRSAGTWAGNLIMAQKFPDFPSDIFLTLTALDARVSFLNYRGEVVGNVPVQNFCKQGEIRNGYLLPTPPPFLTSQALPPLSPLFARRIACPSQLTSRTTARCC